MYLDENFLYDNKINAHRWRRKVRVHSNNNSFDAKPRVTADSNQNNRSTNDVSYVQKTPCP